MATYYVKSGAAGAADGSDWTNAYTTLKAAMEARLAGDTFYVSHQHAETQATALTITSPGTAASPQLVYCVNDGATPPTALATTATVTTTSTSAITILGNAYFYGITWNCGTGSTTDHISLGNNSTSFSLKFENCAFVFVNTASTNRLGIGGTAFAATDLMGYVEFVNTTVTFSHASQFISLTVGRFFWKNTPSAIGGATFPTTLFSAPNGSGGVAILSGVDLSALASKNLVGATPTSSSKIELRNCKFGSSFTVKNGTIPSMAGVEICVNNCDSGATNNAFQLYTYQGSIVQETTIIRTGGANDGTNGISYKMVSLSSGPNYHTPLYSPPIYIWNNTTGSAKTLTVEFVHDSITNLKDNEIWAEVEYLGNGSFPVSSLANDRSADIFATATNQTSSSATWTTTGLTNPNKQSCDVTLTPNMKGPFQVRVCLAKANYTVYVDPLITVA